MSNGNFGERILRFVDTTLGELEASVAPGLVLPKMFGGHLVRSNARVDLLHLLAQLVDTGTEQVAGVDVRQRAQELLIELDPAEVESFYAYRVAESVGLLGGLSALDPTGRKKAIAASTSPRLIRNITHSRSTHNSNFVVVAARCLDAMERLGLPVDDRQGRRVRKKTLEIFRSATGGWINDGRPGFLQFDIYTPQMYLLAEPFHDRLDSHWHSGLRQIILDLEKLCQPNGTVTWGRSMGALANSMKLEMSVISLEYGFGSDHSWWWSVGRDAAIELESWFASGLIATHQARSSDKYRGPARRLQSTFDLLAKMVWSARRLRRLPEHPRPNPVIWPDVDQLIRFSGGAAVWAHRTKSASFVLPLMAGSNANYVASPRCPGLFEQPVDGFPLLIPTVTLPRGIDAKQIHLIPAGPPDRIIHARDGLEVQHNGWAAVSYDKTARQLEGSRTAIYRQSGRSLEVDEHLRIDGAPAGGALSLAVGEVPGRPLNVKVSPSVNSVLLDTSGIAEWRTHWSQLERVHQFEFELSQHTDIRFSWKVTPKLRVATTEPDHPYIRSLYEAMPDVTAVPAGLPDGDLARRLRSADILHVTGPERWVGVDPDASRKAIEQIRAAGTRIVWTQHSLQPDHHLSEDARRVYALWAEAADGILHGSHYGEKLALAFYQYPRARHYVIPRGHWGKCFPVVVPERSVVETEEGWDGAHIRLAVIGQPLHEKPLQMVVDAVASSDRDDIQLVARVSANIRVPLDRRVIATYGQFDQDRYYRRLTAVDGIIFPMEDDSTLTTGTALDCIGGGIAAIAGPSGFLHETFGEAAIWCGSSEADLIECLSSLTPEALRTAGEEARALQPLHDWQIIGELTSNAFEDIVSESK